MRGLTLASFASLAAAGLGLAGFRVPPPPPRGPLQRPVNLGRVDLPPDLPLPARRHLEVTFGTASVPRVETAIAWGRGTLPGLAGGLPVPLAWRLHLVPGRAFVWCANATWFRYPVLAVSQEYQDGRGRTILGSRTRAGAPPDRQSGALLWAWTILLAPSRTLASADARWERVDADTARLHVSEPDPSLALDLHFHPESGQLARIATQPAPGGPHRMEPFEVTVEDTRPAGGHAAPETLLIRCADAPELRLHLSGWVPNVDALDRLVATERKPRKPS